MGGILRFSFRFFTFLFFGIEGFLAKSKTAESRKKSKKILKDESLFVEFK